jgi:hypothetical protein
MRVLTTMLAVIGLTGLGTVLAPRLKADEANQLTHVTFRAPVEIPGQVLPAGKYTFKVLDFNDPNVVQIFNKNQNKLYATILAVPDYRLKPRGKTVITFEERAVGSPEAIRAWFYPGMNYGHAFVYPRTRARELARLTKTDVPSMPDNLAANTKLPCKSSSDPQVVAMKSAHIKAEKPSGEEVNAAEVFLLPPGTVSSANPLRTR